MIEKRKKNRGREIIIVTLVCLVCLSAVAVGNYFLGKNDKENKKAEKEIVNLNAETTTNKKENLAVDGNVVKEETTSNKVAEVEEKETTKYILNNSDKIVSANTNINSNVGTNNGSNNNTDKSSSSKPDKSNNSSKPDKNNNISVINLKFDENSKIEWPVEGNILLDYSMKNTIYFPTLDTYKCNPAIIIQSEKGTQVKAGVKGIVKEVTTEDEIGNCIIVEIGNGYELTYGQLSDIKVSKGDMLEKDTCIGLVADTTRYYKNEGTNLYFKMTKDGKECDPMDYLN